MGAPEDRPYPRDQLLDSFPGVRVTKAMTHDKTPNLQKQAPKVARVGFYVSVLPQACPVELRAEDQR
jgi:hypothetical protein